MSTEQSKTSGKKHYSQEDKKEAVRLLIEEKMTLQQVADKMGCAVNSIYNWKAKYQKSVKKSGSSIPRQTLKQVKPTKGHFSAKVKKEAMRLILEEKLSLKQTADKIGTSVSSIKNWKAKYQKSQKPKSPVSKKITKAVTVKRPPEDDKPITVSEPQIAFDDFVRDYWNKGTRAVDALLMPSDIGPKIVQYVNEALQHAFEKLR